MQSQSIAPCSMSLSPQSAPDNAVLHDVQYAYQLMTGFPSAVIEDESKTLEDAGLLNAVIIQKR